MLNVTDLRNGVVFAHNNETFQVLSYEHIKMGRGSGTIKIKAKNLKTAAIVNKTFNTGTRVESVNVEKVKVSFLYNDNDGYYFMNSSNFEQLQLDAEFIKNQAKFLKDGMEVVMQVIDATPVSIELPKIVEYKVTETGPSERGNSVTNIFKSATLENGFEAKVPLFIKSGDVIKVNTTSGDYVGRS